MLSKAELVAITLFLGSSTLTVAQQSNFAPTFDARDSFNLYPSFTWQGDNYPLNTDHQFPMDFRFIDVDDDGDLDVFFSMYEDGCPVCYEDIPPETRLCFQENISLGNEIQFAPLEIIGKDRWINFDVADLDADGDVDIYLIQSEYGVPFEIYNISVIKNGSNHSNEFTWIDTMLIDTLSNFPIAVRLSDIDADEDLDLVSLVYSYDDNFESVWDLAYNDE